VSTPLCSLLLLSAASMALIGCSNGSGHSGTTTIAASTLPPVTVSPTTTRPTSYVVRAGDSLAAIAARYGLSRAELITANAIANPDMIRVGQQLKIPPPTATEVTTVPSTAPPTTLPPTTVPPTTLPPVTVG
jgi:LysM repeat protein